MRETEKLNSKEPSKPASPETRSTPSVMTSPALEGDPMTLGPLSRDLSMHLLSLAKKVTAEEVTPKTVSAACQCAAELYKIMKLNWEMKR